MTMVPTAGNSVANGFQQYELLHQVTPPAEAKKVSFGERLAILDAAKGIAACIIVFHHLTFYGRPADLAMDVAPSVVQFLYDDARMIVQLFLVLGGFGLAWTHSSGYITRNSGLQIFIKRYLRLLIPFATMLGLLVVVAPMVGPIEPGNPLIESISLPQFLSHLFFFQGLLGHENLTAGAWYLCIDLQFAGAFLLLGAILSQVHKSMRWSASLPNDMAMVLCGLGIVSAWYWNRHGSLDHTVFYFLSPFVLGAMVAWERKNKVSKVLLLGYSVAVASSLLIDYRPRLLVALICGGALWSVIRYGNRLKAPASFVWLGKISYSLFVSHFIALSLTMVALDGWMAASPIRALIVMLLSFVASLIVAPCLYYGVELPFQLWLKGTGKPTSAASTGNTPHVPRRRYGYLRG